VISLLSTAARCFNLAFGVTLPLGMLLALPVAVHHRLFLLRLASVHYLSPMLSCLT
jgi:hypothetical protein